MLFHVSDEERYRWLNDRVCAVEGEVRPRPDGAGFDVVLDVSLMTSTFGEPQGSGSAADIPAERLTGA